MNPARIQVRTIQTPLSARARLISALLRQVTRRAADGLEDDAGLVQLRHRVARVDRAIGALNLLHRRRFHWDRATMGGIRARIVRPMKSGVDAAPKGRVLLYLHGGAFFMRSFHHHMALAAAILRDAGIARAVLPLYRLAPEHPFPAAIDDCHAVYLNLLATGTHARDIVIAGDSAGGGLVLKLLMRLRDERVALPACGVLLSPFTDLSCSGDSIQDNAARDALLGSLPTLHARFYLGRLSANDPRCSPLFGDFAALPPLLVQVGSDERLLDDSLRLLPRIRRAGGALDLEVWNGVPHCWQALSIPEAKQAIASVGTFVRRSLSAGVRLDGVPPSRRHPRWPRIAMAR